MFLGLAVIVIVLSAVFSMLGVTAVNPSDGSTVQVFNLLSVAGIKYLWTNVITNFSGFAPLGMVLVAVVGSSLAEKSGFLVAVMEKFLGGAKGWIVTCVVVFLGINLNVAGDAGNIVLPPLAAVLFMSVGRHPLLGLYTAFASVSAGFCANMILGLSDALAYGFTEPAAQMIDPTYSESIAINWYLLLIAVLLLSLPIFGPTAILADENGSITASASPFSKGIVFTVTLFLFVPGLFYGIGTGKYKKDKDVWADISQGFAEMGSYVFMCFFISIFTNFFSVSKIGTIIAIKGAEFLSNVGLTGMLLVLGIIVLTCLINLLIGSTSVKWAILAPIFVPMLMLLGYNPAFIQVVYRIGDSLTNPLTPLNAYLPIALSFARKYDKNVGIGTLIANMIPFSVSFAVIWIIQLAIWYFLNLPLGPGGVIFLQ